MGAQDWLYLAKIAADARGVIPKLRDVCRWALGLNAPNPYEDDHIALCQPLLHETEELG
jgi:hypothetical protein